MIRLTKYNSLRQGQKGTQSLYHNIDKQQRKWNTKYCCCGLSHEVKMAPRRGELLKAIIKYINITSEFTHLKVLKEKRSSVCIHC